MLFVFQLQSVCLLLEWHVLILTELNRWQRQMCGTNILRRGVVLIGCAHFCTNWCQVEHWIRFWEIDAAIDLKTESAKPWERNIHLLDTRQNIILLWKNCKAFLKIYMSQCLNLCLEVSIFVVGAFQFTPGIEEADLPGGEMQSLNAPRFVVIYPLTTLFILNHLTTTDCVAPIR